MKYTLVKVETLQPGARFVRVESRGGESCPQYEEVVTYEVLRQKCGQRNTSSAVCITNAHMFYENLIPGCSLVFAEAGE